MRDAEQVEALDAGRIDNRFEITDEILKSDVGHLAIRQSVAARVVSIEGVIARQFAVEMPPDRIFEIEFEMGHPVAGLHQRRAPANSGIGQLHTVLGLAEMDFLFVRQGRRG